VDLLPLLLALGITLLYSRAVGAVVFVCPRTLADLNQSLISSDAALEEFVHAADASTRVLQLYGNTYVEQRLTLFAPYFLGSDKIIAVANRCWVHYESFRRELSLGNRILAQRTMLGWTTCLRDNYRSELLPAPAQELLSCFYTIAKAS